MVPNHLLGGTKSLPGDLLGGTKSLTWWYQIFWGTKNHCDTSYANLLQLDELDVVSYQKSYEGVVSVPQVSRVEADKF